MKTSCSQGYFHTSAWKVNSPKFALDFVEGVWCLRCVGSREGAGMSAEENKAVISQNTVICVCRSFKRARRAVAALECLPLRACSS
jgi:hypothetical protein